MGVLTASKSEEYYKERMRTEHDSMVKDDGTLKDVLKMPNFAKAMPQRVFTKNIWLAMFFLIWDCAVVFSLEIGFYKLCASAFYAGLPVLARCALIFVFWQVTGFFFWCIFVIGHDCGHNTFSNSYLLDSVIGHVTHGFLLVPFWPWARSHHMHHLKHNHSEKDFSHPWILKETVADWKLFREHRTIRVFWDWILCYIAFPLYLIAGMPDGSHILPIGGGRLYKNVQGKEKTKCIVSSTVCGLYLVLFFSLASSFSQLVIFYGGPWIIFCWWLLTVTHFHHHQLEGSTVYDDSTFTYMKGALQTIDRDYGFLINHLSHHITDCHLVHHIWFTKVPHYRLKEASREMRVYLTKHGYEDLCEVKPTKDFFLRIFKSFSFFKVNCRLLSLKKQE